MRLVADANVLLSAVIGGRASNLILTHERVEQVFTTRFTLAEVQEYAVVLAKKKRLSTDLIMMAAATLPVILIDRTDYEPCISDAERRIGHRDPDDVELLALALHLQLPVWSNDNDFQSAGVLWYTSSQLLAALDAGAND